MPAIKITTTTGQFTIDPAEIDSLTYRLGGQEQIMERPHILEMFNAFMAADEAHGLKQDVRNRLAQAGEQQDKVSDALRRKLRGE